MAESLQLGLLIGEHTGNAISTTQTMMFNWFKKKPTIPQPDRWPSRSCDHKQWMRDTVKYYELQGYDPRRLFTPHTRDYFPLNIHTASFFTDDRLREYREIKVEYPVYVNMARNTYTEDPLIRAVFVSKIVDPEDLYKF